MSIASFTDNFNFDVYILYVIFSCINIETLPPRLLFLVICSDEKLGILNIVLLLLFSHDSVMTIIEKSFLKKTNNQLLSQSFSEYSEH